MRTITPQKARLIVPTAANRTYGSGGGHKKEPAKQALFQG